MRRGMTRMQGLPAALMVAVASLGSACGTMTFDFPGPVGPSDGGLEAASTSTPTPVSCAAHETACGASCADLQSDPRSCGQCGATCSGATPVCDRGSCAASCSAGLVDCAGSCVDTATDRRHCSACGATCSGSDVCIGGQCSCPVGKERCGPSCVHLASDPLNCGACGVRCDGATPVCNAGVCRASCTGGLSACAGACVDLRLDPEHCGACALVCANGACTRGECVCTTGQVLCGKRCVDTMRDGNNCGVCGRGCPASRVCSGGTCI